MKKILLTGATGFLGKNLKEELCGEYELFQPTHHELDLLNTDLVEAYVRDNKIQIVIHAAKQRTLGYSEKYFQMELQNNLRMFMNLERCKKYYEKMIYIGSGAEYGKKGYKPLMKEEYFGTVIPEDIYGLSKYTIAKLCEVSSNIYNLRVFGIYGPYDDWRYRFLPNTIHRCIRGEDIVIRQNVSLDYIYIKDFCEMVRRFLKIEPKYRCYNACSGNPITILEMAKAICKISGSKSLIRVEQEGMGMEYSGSNNRILNEIGEMHYSILSDSLQETIKAYNDLAGNETK